MVQHEEGVESGAVGGEELLLASGIDVHRVVDLLEADAAAARDSKVVECAGIREGVVHGLFETLAGEKGIATCGIAATTAAVDLGLVVDEAKLTAANGVWVNVSAERVVD